MDKQKVHPAESSRDEKMDELLQHIPDDLFFAKEEKAPACNLDFVTQDVLKFQFDLSEDERYRLKYKGRNLRSYDHFIFYEAGLKGILAFFYALDRGYETVHLEEVDTTDPALCFRMEAVSEKTADSCLFTFDIPLRPGNAKSAKRNPSIISSSRCRKIFPTRKGSGTTYEKDLMRTATRPFWTKK